MKVSVVITAYNVEEYIEHAINSVLSQTFKDLEVVVVIDCPTDNTKEIVEKIALTNSQVKVVNNETNLGAGLSRRVGIENSIGEYVLLLDGDDYLHETFIESLYNKAIETDADVVSGGIEVLSENGVRDITLYGEQVTEGYDKIIKFWGERIVFMNNKLIRRSLHEKVPYCHRRYIEDTPVIIPQLWYANKVAYVDNAGYVYRMHKNSLTHTTNIIKDVIYKGLCWCDLIDFFSENDKEFFKVFPLANYITNVIEVINGNKFTDEQIKPYEKDWCEFTMRLFNLISISDVKFK